MKIKLGSQVLDIISGIEGIATSRVEYITGCTQYGVTPPAKDGKPSDACYFDEQRLRVIGEGIKLLNKRDGGPSPAIPYKH